MVSDPNLKFAKSVLAEALALSVEEVDDDARIGNVANWDSLAHLRLIMAIEMINGDVLDAEKMVSISCLGDIAEALNIQYQKKIWLIGDGRSGTTWVSRLINYDRYFREVFEPFHPGYVPQMNFLSSHDYVRPEDENARLHQVSDQVFSGALRNARTDHANEKGVYEGLLIKDIFSNLFARWVYRNYADVKIILLIRNPFAVALSKSSRQDWRWVTDPMSLLNQKDLRDDHLLPYVDLIHRTCERNDFILNQILIWSIIYTVPFQQFRSGQLHPLFYENVFADPQSEISGLSGIVGKEFGELPREVIEKPTGAVGDTIRKGKSPITSWMNDLPSNTIDEGMKILERFGLDNLYDQNSMPASFDIDSFQAPS